MRYIKSNKLVFGVVAVALGYCAAAKADFTGDFSGLYAPANWTIAVSGNATYDASAQVVSGSSHNVSIVGANGAGLSEVTPLSTINFSIVLPGSGPETVSFLYSFINPLGLADNTAAIYDGSTFVANLTSANTLFQLSGTFHGGDTLDFKVNSANVNLADVLQIAPVPEPSTIALLAVGGVLCGASRLRKSFRR